MKNDQQKTTAANNKKKAETKLNPEFKSPLSNPETFLNHLHEISYEKESPETIEILKKLTSQINKIDYAVLAYPKLESLRIKREQIKQDIMNTDGNMTDNKKTELTKIEKKIDSFTLTIRHFLIITIENLIKVANENSWGLCKNHEFIFLYNGAYWMSLDKNVFQMFLGEAAEKMGIDKFYARHYKFRASLFEQFIATSYLPSPESNKDLVLINLKNGTFEVSPTLTRIKPFDKSDFLTYQLPFNYNPDAQAPIFKNFLDEVVPDNDKQKILAEYLGYVFIKNGNSHLKEEKCLLLYGTGANGKSVFYEVVNALLGFQNVSCYSLQSLTNENGYYRAMLGNSLVNYATEINGKLEASHFKAMVSGEPLEARLAYGIPFKLTQYAKLIFNCNELPKDVEHSLAYFRRFLIIHFNVTIPEDKQDKQLHNKIIENELSGVFNWVLNGLKRLLDQKKFSECEAIQKAREEYEKESNSVKLFLEEYDYVKHSEHYLLIKDLYNEYKSFCFEDGYRPVNKSNFKRRLEGSKILVKRFGDGNVAFLEKTVSSFNTDIPF